MRQRLLVGCLLLIIFTLQIVDAACPITHAAFTEMLWEYHDQYNEEDKMAFMIGTLFPDIRYLAECDRSVTHFDHVTLEDVLLEKNPFLAGMLFHSYVDKEREVYLVSKGIYDYISPLNSPRPTTLIKLVEDEFIFDLVDLVYCKRCVKVILDEETKFGIELDKIEEWHYLLNNYFTYKPSVILNYLSWKKIGIMGIKGSQMGQMYSNHQVLLKDPAMNDYVEGLLSHFENLLQNKQKDS